MKSFNRLSTQDREKVRKRFQKGGFNTLQLERSSINDLQEIDISGCFLTESPYLLSIHNLKTLNISNNSIQIFNSILLPRTISVVNASCNRIKYVSVDHLHFGKRMSRSVLQNSNLRLLDLSENRIRSLPEYCFNFAPCLEVRKV